MPRRKHTQTDTFIQHTLREEITALKRRIEDFEREIRKLYELAAAINRLGIK